MAREFDDPGDFNPYDLGTIGRMREREKATKDSQRAAAHAEVQRRMERQRTMGGGVNPYDLSQMAYIFEPLNALDRHHF